MKDNRVRIVGGTWRSRLLAFPDVVGLRPTPDRVRETLFNWLGQSLDGKACLDLFAGSGALGFEALSRGAKQVVMVERDRNVVRVLQQNAATLGAERLELVEADALRFVAGDPRRFDVIFVDPPYGLKLLPEILPALASHLGDDGVVYAESDAPFEPGAEWRVWRSGKAGQVRYCLLMRADQC